MKTKLIGFSGAAGAGKTTLAKRLAEILKKHGYHAYTITNTARQILELFISTRGVQSLNDIRLKGMYNEFQVAVLEDYYSTYHFLKSCGVLIEHDDDSLEVRDLDFIIADRTIYDIIMYSLMFYDPYSDDMQFIKLLNLFNHRYSKLIKYDLIFLCQPIDSEDLDDGVRTYDLHTRDIQHELMKILLPEYIELEAKPVEDRLKDVIYWINKKFNIELSL